MRTRASCVALLGLLLFGAPSLPAANLLTNGNFEAANTGFTSEYTFSTFGHATYTITTDPSIPYPSSISFHDHTSGSGMMLTADGAVTGNVALWAASVTVAPGTTYSFSGFDNSWGNDGTGHDISPANLQILVNGVPIGTTTCSSTDGVWTGFAFSWPSGAATTANLKIVDLNTADSGNDPALDDLSFAAPGAAAIPLPPGWPAALVLIAFIARYVRRHALPVTTNN